MSKCPHWTRRIYRLRSPRLHKAATSALIWAAFLILALGAFGQELKNGAPAQAVGSSENFIQVPAGQGRLVITLSNITVTDTIGGAGVSDQNGDLLYCFGKPTCVSYGGALGSPLQICDGTLEIGFPHTIQIPNPAQGAWYVSCAGTINIYAVDSYTVTATYAPAAPSVTSPLQASGVVGQPFSYSITATGNPTSFGAAGPPWMGVNAASGEISGVPTTPGTFQISVSASNSGGTGSATLTVTVAPPPPQITSPLEATATVGQAFTYQITASGNPTTFAATGAAWLAVNQASGLLAGTPTSVGTFSITLTASNSGGTGHAVLTVTVTAAPPRITSALQAAATVGRPFSYQITASGNPTTFAATGASWLAVNTTSGLLAGTPPTAGTVSIILTASNAGGSARETLSLTVVEPSAPSITSPLQVLAALGQPFSYQITATGQPTQFEATGATWLSVNTTNGLITGTPSETGVYDIALTARNAVGAGIATLAVTVSLPAAPQITSPTQVPATVGQPFNYQIAATSDPTSFGAAGPAWLVVNTATGALSGTPTATGSFSITLTAANAGGTGQTNLVLMVWTTPIPQITSVNRASATNGQPFNYQITATPSPEWFDAAGLPSGLSINAVSGLVSGTPIQSGDFTVTISAGNNDGTDSLIVDLMVEPSVAEPGQYTFASLAGSFPQGFSDGLGSTARFNQPWGGAVDSVGNIYVADTFNHTIRKVSQSGLVSTLAGLAGARGGADGQGSAARFNQPQGVAVDDEGNVFVADWGNNALRRITPDGVVATIGRFPQPTGVAVDNAGNIFVSDIPGPFAGVERVTPDGVRTTFVILSGADASPGGLAVDSAGNIFAAVPGASTIHKVTALGVETILAGSTGVIGTNDGAAGEARFNQPVALAVDASDNLYVADTGNCTIRKISAAGMVTTIAGTQSPGSALYFREADGPGRSALFSCPSGIAVDHSGAIFIVDTGYSDIRRIAPDGLVTTLAGWAAIPPSTDGVGGAAHFGNPWGVAVDTMGNIYVANNSDGDNTICKISPSAVVTTFAGTPTNWGCVDGIGSSAQFASPCGVAADMAGNLYVADSYSSIRKVTPAGVVSTLAGSGSMSDRGSADGTGAAARFNQPQGVAADGAGNVYVADTHNCTIRAVTPDGVVTTIAGHVSEDGGYLDGAGANAWFCFPSGIAIDRTGNIYIADTYNCVIRKLTRVGTTWMVSTLAGSPGSPGSADGPGGAARFNYPRGIAVDAAGNVYVADSSNFSLRKVTPSGIVSTLGGLAAASFGLGGTGGAARFVYPMGVAVDGAGSIYVSDSGIPGLPNGVVWKGTLSTSLDSPLLMNPLSTSGQFGFSITGQNGSSMEVESSSDLSRWQVVGTFLLDAGTNYFSNPYPMRFSRYYRGRLR